MADKEKNEKILTVGIPAYHAKSTIEDCISSIQMQSVKDVVSIIIAIDDPIDNYDFVLKRFPNMDITILKCEKNTGPGLARQRALDACKTPWITFIDADDVFFNPFALENFLNNITPNAIEVQGAFLQEVAQGNLNIAQKQQIAQSGGQIPPRAMPRNDVGHP